MSSPRLTVEWTRRAEGWQRLVRNGLREAVEIDELIAGAPIEHIAEGLSALHFGLSHSVVMMPIRPPASHIIGLLDRQLSLISLVHGPTGR